MATTTVTAASSASSADTTASLQGRGRRLRQWAASSNPLLAESYRRRAAELDLQAWLEAVWNPPIDLRTSLDPKTAPRLCA
jgi:hypothetical protein